mmetsp:Transcript_28940/g.65587  ORF Transcript_28940/g.65587 Transcript_28940/m.65587 type:complete len:322 (+) Transcript_28940:575-1540(+)
MASSIFLISPLSLLLRAAAEFLESSSTLSVKALISCLSCSRSSRLSSSFSFSFSRAAICFSDILCSLLLRTSNSSSRSMVSCRFEISLLAWPRSLACPCRIFIFCLSASLSNCSTLLSSASTSRSAASYLSFSSTSAPSCPLRLPCCFATLEFSLTTCSSSPTLLSSPLTSLSASWYLYLSFAFASSALLCSSLPLILSDPKEGRELELVSPEDQGSMLFRLNWSLPPYHMTETTMAKMKNAEMRMMLRKGLEGDFSGRPERDPDAQLPSTQFLRNPVSRPRENAIGLLMSSSSCETPPIPCESLPRKLDMAAQLEQASPR